MSRLSRREFLRLGTLAGGAAILVACAPATPAPTEAPSEPEPEEEEPEPEPEEPEEEPAPTPAPAEKVEVRFSMWDWYATVPDVQWDVWNQEKAFPRFAEESPDITVTWEPQGDFDKILTEMAAGTAADIISVWDPHMSVWSNKKQLLDLQPLVDVDFPDHDEIFIKGAWDQMWDPFNNIRMGMLSDLDITHIWYNKAAFEEANVPLPTVDWDLDDYVATADALTVKDDDGEIARWGGLLRTGWLGWFYHVENFGGQVRDEETRMTCLLGEPEAQEGLEWCRHVMWDLNVFAQPNQMAATGVPDLWSTGIPSGIFAFAEQSATYYGAFAESMPEGSWDIAHMPKGPKDRACMGLPDQWVIYQGVIDRGTKDATWEFMKFLQGEWYQGQIAVTATRIPGLLSAADSFVASLRETIPALEQVSMEVLTEMLAMGYPRRASVFRYQQVAEELIQPAMDAVFVEGKEPVSIFQDVADAVNQAQLEAKERDEA